MKPVDVLPDQPIVNILGERVALGSFSREIVPYLNRWHNDFEVVRSLGGAPAPLTEELDGQRYDQTIADDASILFTIYERSTWRPIGYTGLAAIEHRHRRADYIIVLGEPDFRGRGLGSETARLMLDYAFSDLGLQNVQLQVFGYNLAGLRAYEKAGFREFGRRRESKFMGGRLWDTIYMDCLAGEQIEGPRDER